MTTQPPRAARKRRPFALLALIGVMIFRSALIFLVTLGSFQLSESDLLKIFRVEAIANAAGEVYLVLLGLVVLGALVLVSAIGLLARKRFGWIIAMVMTGIFVLFDIIGFVQGTANYVWMALNIITVFYLNQRDVRESVGAVMDDDVDTSSAVLA